MEVFTYKDYISYEEIIEKQMYAKTQCVAEECAQYHCGDKSSISNDNDANEIINNEHDKIFRKILDDKVEAAKFINKALKFKNKIQPNDIEKYNSSFVTDKLKNEESDIIYKLKDKNIFILIEHQTKIDNTMAYRILEYELEILKSAIDVKNMNKKGYKYPSVIPIVLYSGRKKWNGKTSLGDMQENLNGIETLELSKYNVVDVNDYTEEELLKDDSFLSKAMLIEKTRYTDNLAIYLQKITEEVIKQEEVYTKEQRRLLSTIIEIVLRAKLEKDLTESLIKKLREGDNNMLAVVEMIKEENAMLIAKGVRKNKLETAKKMLKENLDVELICRITGLKQEEIKGLSK